MAEDNGSNGQEYSDEDREKAREYYEQAGASVTDIAQKVGVATGTIQKWSEQGEWKRPSERDEEPEEVDEDLARRVRGLGSVTPSDIEKAAKSLPGVGGKRAQALAEAAEMRESVLQDPNELYQLANIYLELDHAMMDHLIKSIYPHLESEGAAMPGGPQNQVQYPTPGQSDGRRGGGPEQQKPQYPQPGMGGPQNQTGAQGPYGVSQQQGDDSDMKMMMQMMMQQQQELLESIGQNNSAQPSESPDVMQMMMQQQQQLLETIAQDDNSQSGKSEDDVLKEELRALRNDMRDMQNGDSLTDSLQELAEIQETMKNLKDDGSAPDSQMADMVAALRQEINQVRQEVASEGGGDGLDPEFLTTADSDMATLALLADNESLDGNTLATLATTLNDDGDKPAEVQKAEIEKDIRKMETKQKQQMYESIFENLEDMAGGVLGAIAGGADGGQPPAEGQPAPTQQQSNQPSETVRERRPQPQNTPAKAMVEDEIGQAEVEEPHPDTDTRQAGEESDPDTDTQQADDPGTDTQQANEETQPAETDNPQTVSVEASPEDVMRMVNDQGWDTDTWQQFQADARSDGLTPEEAGQVWDVVKEAKADDAEAETE